MLKGWTMFAELTGGHAFLECPRWSGGRLWVSDLYANRVLAVSSDGLVTQMAEVPGRPSGLGFAPDGTAWVVSMADSCVLRVDTGAVVAELQTVVAPPANDMLLDAEGRAYVGSPGFDLAAGQPPVLGGIAMIGLEGEVRLVADGLAFPNGMALTEDGATLLVAETMGAQITAFRRAADGSLSERRVWARLPGCMPDGVALDALGGLWVADPGARHVIRVEEEGRVTHDLSTPARAYGCALGGPDGRTLFVCTADTFHTGPALARKSSAVVTVRVETPAVTAG